MSRLALSRTAAAHVSIARALILAAALVSLLVSVALWFTGSRESGIFVGLWVPSILALGAMVVPRRIDA